MINTDTDDIASAHRPVQLEGGRLACSCGEWTSIDSGPARYPTPEEQHGDHIATRRERAKSARRIV